MKFYKAYLNKTFKIGTIAESYKQIFQICECNYKDINFSLSTKNGEIESSKTINLDDLHTIIELNKNNYSLHCSYNFGSTSEKKFEHILILVLDNILNISIESEKAEILLSIHEILIKQLELKEYIYKPEESINSKVERIENRLALIEEKIIDKNKNISCFISMRFDDKSKKYLQNLEKFLTLLIITIVTGLSYEPRKVSEKVISKLDQNIDFVLYLITNENESFWTRDELVYGSQKGYFVIPLVEKGEKIY